LPEIPFSAGGNSGSIYYIERGAFRYPIGIHKGQSLFKTPNLHFIPNYCEEKCLHQNISFGTCLKNAIDRYLSYVNSNEQQRSAVAASELDDQEESSTEAILKWIFKHKSRAG
jgi:hypothetical protein